ncbi:LytR family transcriptional regulator [Streptomyces sp. GC420]|nr:LytR family transcriptional regulator [Streptomyces sp. GC420]
MGGKYRITGNAYPRMRRPRRRRKILLGGLAAIVALGLAGWGTLQLIDIFGGEEQTVRTASGSACRTPSPSASSATKARALPKPSQITVNVFNATPRSGLAKETADELKKRGFKIGEVGNATAEYDKKVKGTGILLGAPEAQEAVLPVLATQLAGAGLKADARKGKDVDLIIGSAFTSLAKKAVADKALAALAEPSPAPLPSGC